MSQTNINHIRKKNKDEPIFSDYKVGQEGGERKSKSSERRDDDRILSIMQKKNSSLLSNPIFRNHPKQLSETEVLELIIKNDFFDKNRNGHGNGFNTHFEATQINGDKVIVDYNSRLMWQQHGSLEPMSFEKAQQWIAELNQIGYGNFKDWRLPTLEEAMSLIKNKRRNSNLFQCQFFGQKQSGIWTSDFTENAILVWVVYFRHGSCHANCFDLDNYVRAVRLT